MRVSRGDVRKITGRLSVLAQWTLFAWASCGFAAMAHAATLDPSVLPKIQAATFEVVQAKPTSDPLSYEKPLPLDLLPYQERTDKYYSIGTAFALGHNRYVTAGHVLLAGVGSLWGPPELRDASGHVYPIDKIEKFSLRKDFVVFSLAGSPGDAALDVDTQPALNQAVYAVGNALGTGVVIRDGLYTSDTPEEQDGSWKWMRFSAAASPGNSGGPLLDQGGKVIGVVLMKSANENLNYALPIREVLNAPDHLAVIDVRTNYQLDVFDAVQNSDFKAQFDLPESFADFSTTFQKLFDANSDKQLAALLAKESGELFPQGAGSSRLLHRVARTNPFPALIVRNGSGEWGLAGRQGQRIPLAHNGYVDPGNQGRNVMVHVGRPDDVPASRFYGDPSVLMDQLAQTGVFKRPVGTEQVKITSLGEPSYQAIHTDAWQRQWQVAEWPLPFANMRVLVFSLPVPDGYVSMLRFALPGHEHDSLLDLGELTNFVDVAYEGTLAQWKDYLQEGSLLPAAFKDIRLDFDYGHRFAYASPRLSFSFTPELQQIAADSRLTLGFGYLPDHGKVAWDVGDVRVKENADGHAMINIQRDAAPSDDLDESFKNRWNKLVQRQHPFDGVAHSEDDATRITAVVDPPAGAPPAVLYTALYSLEGTQPQAVMKAKLDLLTKNVQVGEH